MGNIGMASFAERMCKEVRGLMYLAGGCDIPDGFVVKKQNICAAGHPGVCVRRDVALYRALGRLPRALHSFIAKDSGVPVGSGLRLQGVAPGGNVRLTMEMLVAFVRKRDPGIVSFAFAAGHQRRCE